jgi:hypothetical protein
MGLNENFQRVQGLMSAFVRGDRGLAGVPTAVESVISSGAWRHYVTEGGTEVQHKRFEDFVCAAPLAGLGSSMEQLRGLCVRSPEALRAIDAEVSAAMSRSESGEQGGRGNKAPRNTRSFKEGETVSRTLRRLKRDNPELAKQVIDGELSAHAAAIKAGFRKPSITLQANDPGRAARRIREVLGCEFAARLGALLLDEVGDQ